MAGATVVELSVPCLLYCMAMDIRLLSPADVVGHWAALRPLLTPAVAQGRGEVEPDDLLRLCAEDVMCLLVVADGNDFKAAITLETLRYPRKTVLLVGFGGGNLAGLHARCTSILQEAARRIGADSIQTYVRSPAMVRYHQKHFGAEPIYTVMEIKP